MPVLLATRILVTNSVPVHYIRTHIGHAPRHAFVEAADYVRRTGQCGSAHIHIRPGQLDLVPDGGQRQIQVRVVGENRVAGCRFCAAHRPVVAADVALEFGFRRLEPGRKGGLAFPGHTIFRCRILGCKRNVLRGFGRGHGLEIPFGAGRDNRVFAERIIGKQFLNGGLAVLFQHISHFALVIAGGQCGCHLLEQQRRFQRFPRLGGVVQHLVFERIILGRQTGNVRIHPGGVSLQHFLAQRVGEHGLQRCLGRRNHAPPPRVAVQFHGAFANDFADPSGGGVGLQFHLPQPVGSGDVALRVVQIVAVGGKNVRHAVVVEHYGHFAAQAGQGEFPFGGGMARFGIGPETAERIEELAHGRSRTQPRIEGIHQAESEQQRGNGFGVFHAERQVFVAGWQAPKSKQSKNMDKKCNRNCKYPGLWKIAPFQKAKPDSQKFKRRRLNQFRAQADACDRTGSTLAEYGKGVWRF